MVWLYSAQWEKAAAVCLLNSKLRQREVIIAQVPGKKVSWPDVMHIYLEIH